MAAIPRAREILGELWGAGWPDTSRVPESGATAPVMILMRVDFPAPFSPTSAWTSPSRRSKETSSSACRPAYDLLMAVACRSNFGFFTGADIVIPLPDRRRLRPQIFRDGILRKRLERRNDDSRAHLC